MTFVDKVRADFRCFLVEVNGLPLAYLDCRQCAETKPGD